MFGMGQAVIVPIQFAYSQAMHAISQMRSGVSGLNNQVRQLNAAAMTGPNGLGGQVASGIGAFYLLHQAAGMAFNTFKSGITQAADLEQALSRLQSVSGATDEEMIRLSKSATKISGDLGPIDILDVVHNMEALNRIVGATVPNIEKFIGPFSEFTNAMVLVSAGKIDAAGSASILQRMLASFGGLKNNDNIDNIINEVYKGISAFSPEDPERFIRGIQSAAPMMRSMGLPMEQMIQMAALRTEFPTGGLRAAGPDIESFLLMALDAPGRLAKASPKKRAAMQNSFETLGVLTRDGKPAIIDPTTGKPDAFRLMVSLNQSIQKLKEVTPPDQYYSTLASTFKEVMPEKIGRRIGMLFADPTNLQAFADIVAKIANAENMQDATKRQEAGTKGAFDKFSSNLSNLMIKTFDWPSKAAGYFAEKAAIVMADVTEKAENNRAVKAGMTGAVGGFTASIVSSIAGLLLSGLAARLLSSSFAGTLFGGSAAVGLRGASAIMFGLTKFNIYAAIISSLLLAGGYAYESSPKFKEGVDKVAGFIERWFEVVKGKTLDAAQVVFPPPKPSEEKKDFVGPKQPWFDATRTKLFGWMKNVSSPFDPSKGGLLGQYLQGQDTKGFGQNFFKGKGVGIQLDPSASPGWQPDIMGWVKDLWNSPMKTLSDTFTMVSDAISKFFNTIVDILVKVKEWFTNFAANAQGIYDTYDEYIQNGLNSMGAGAGAAIDQARNAPPPPAPTPKPKIPPPDPNSVNLPKDNNQGSGKRNRQQEALTGRALMREFTRYLAEDVGMDMRAGSPHRSQAIPSAPVHQR